jgi:HAD superfamily phosphoserine phosphatase-like hydrolase
VTAPAITYRTVIFDVDSTLTGIEGVDWLAALRDAETASYVQGLTERVMAGELPIEAAYVSRLDRIAPTRDEVRELAAAYRDAVAPDARAVIGALVQARVRVVAVSGGLAAAVVPFCVSLGFAEPNVRAVPVEWSERGTYVGMDPATPLATQAGKALVVQQLAAPHPILAVGDGSTDLEMKRRGAVDVFAAYTGFTRRPAVIAEADFVVRSFTELLERIERRG